MRNLFLIMLLISLLLTACSAGGQSGSSPTVATSEGTIGKPVEIDGGAYTDISVEELQAMFENKDFLFVNVHIPF